MIAYALASPLLTCESRAHGEDRSSEWEGCNGESSSTYHDSRRLPPIHPELRIAALEGTATMSSDDQDPPCKLYALTQYQCSPRGGKIACWPLERIFRQ